MALVSGQLNFSVLETCINYEHDKFQPMSIALPTAVISDIIKIQNSTNEQKQRYIEEKIDKTNLCEGYFFKNDNQVLSSTSFRNLYLETCDENLDTFIRERTKEPDFQWTILQEMCYQLVDSVSWLHQGNIYYDGRLHPRNILVKRSKDAKWNVKLKIPEKLNPFNNLDELYTQLWSTVKKPVSEEATEEQLNQTLIQRDLISIAILLYFIQSAGYHPYQRSGLNNSEADDERDNYTAIMIQIKSELFQVEALDKKCFCNAEMECNEKMECKYRLWINLLAKDHTTKMLKPRTNELLQNNIHYYTNQSVEKLKEHPFFWKTTDVLTFIERSSNYLHEGANQDKKKKFGVLTAARSINRIQSQHQPWLLDHNIFSELERDGEDGNDYKSIFEFLHETKIFQTGEKSLMKNAVTSFGGLLKQIRNKSCHWNEETPRGKKAKEVLKNIRFLTFKKIDEQTSFCLFWLIHFPTLLLYTWEQLKGEVAAHQ